MLWIHECMYRLTFSISEECEIVCSNDGEYNSYDGNVVVMYTLVHSNGYADVRMLHTTSKTMSHDCYSYV